MIGRFGLLSIGATVLALVPCAPLDGAALSADVSIQKRRISPAPAVPGRLLNFLIEVSNAGPNDASNVVIEDALPPGTTLFQASGPDFDCPQSVVGGKVTVTCTLTTLPVTSGPFGYGPFLIELEVLPGTAGSIVNTATVSSDTPDPDLSNNSSTVVTEIAPSVPVPGVALTVLGLAIAATGILRLKP